MPLTPIPWGYVVGLVALVVALLILGGAFLADVEGATERERGQ